MIYIIAHSQHGHIKKPVIAITHEVSSGGAYNIAKTASVVYPYEETGVILHDVIVLQTHTSLPDAVVSYMGDATKSFFDIERERHQKLCELQIFHRLISNSASVSPHKVLGLDFHGVINLGHKVLQDAMAQVIEGGHEVHIMTGCHADDNLENDLLSFGFIRGSHYTHLFSIQDFLVKNCIPVSYDDKGMPHADAHYWDMAKGAYALSTGMDAVWDDSPVYGRYMPPKCWYFTYSAENLESQLKQVIEGTRPRIGRSK